MLVRRHYKDDNKKKVKLYKKVVFLISTSKNKK